MVDARSRVLPSWGAAASSGTKQTVRRRNLLLSVASFGDEARIIVGNQLALFNCLVYVGSFIDEPTIDDVLRDAGRRRHCTGKAQLLAQARGVANVLGQLNHRLNLRLRAHFGLLFTLGAVELVGLAQLEQSAELLLAALALLDCLLRDLVAKKRIRISLVLVALMSFGGGQCCMISDCAVSVPVVFLSRERLTGESFNQLLVHIKLLFVLLLCLIGLFGLSHCAIRKVIIGIIVTRVLCKVRDGASKRRYEVLVMPFVNLTHSLDGPNHARSLHV